MLIYTIYTRIGKSHSYDIMYVPTYNEYVMSINNLILNTTLSSLHFLGRLLWEWDLNYIYPLINTTLVE